MSNQQVPSYDGDDAQHAYQHAAEEEAEELYGDMRAPHHDSSSDSASVSNSSSSLPLFDSSSIDAHRDVDSTSHQPTPSSTHQTALNNTLAHDNTINQSRSFTSIASSDQSASKYIYVENLPLPTSDAYLHGLFSDFGVITRIFIATDRNTKAQLGFAFINFETDEQGELAIAKMNGTPLENGRVLRCAVAKNPKRDRTNTPLNNYYNNQNVLGVGAAGSFNSLGDLNNQLVVGPLVLPSPMVGGLMHNMLINTMQPINNMSNNYFNHNAAASNMSSNNSSSRSFTTPAPNSIFVGHLPSFYTEADLQQLFAHCGTITQATIIIDLKTGISKQQGFVHFESNDAATTAIHNWNGQVPPQGTEPLHVRLAYPKKSDSDDSRVARFRPGPDRGPRSSARYDPMHGQRSSRADLSFNNAAEHVNERGEVCLFVFHLPRNITNQELEQLFSLYGTVLHVAIPLDKATNDAKGFAFVNMKDINEAQNAINFLDGYQLGGKRLKVTFKEKSGERDGGSRGSRFGCVSGRTPIPYSPSTFSGNPNLINPLMSMPFNINMNMNTMPLNNINNQMHLNMNMNWPINASQATANMPINNWNMPMNMGSYGGSSSVSGSLQQQP